MECMTYVYKTRVASLYVVLPCLVLLAAQGGGLGCNWAETRVMSLAWNDEDGVLYIGGEAAFMIQGSW